MLSADNDMLRATLSAICRRSNYLSLSKADAAAFMNGLLKQIRVIIADEVAEWNRFNSVQPFPPEILAVCFAFLPLRDRVMVSHVSRAWRSLALSTPSLWTDIRRTPFCASPSAALVKLALSRSGNLPVDVFVPRLQYDRALELVLGSTFHRIRSLKLTSAYSASFLRHPAPVLEKWRCFFVVDIPEDLFGGRPGRLTVFRAFGLRVPSTCPALSTLTHVKVSSAAVAELVRLFTLCPSLKSVTVPGLSGDAPQSLFRVPQSLEYLELGGTEDDDSVGSQSAPVAIYQACSTPRLRVIKLDVLSRPEGENLAPVLDGAVDLDVRVNFGDDEIVLTTRFSGGRQIRTALWYMITHHYQKSEPGRFPPIFKQTAACFADLQAVTLPITLLAPFTADAPPIPSLQELRLMIVEDMVLEFRSTNHSGFPWHLLRGLASVHVPHVILQVARFALESVHNGDDESDAEEDEWQGAGCAADPDPFTVQDGNAMLDGIMAANIPAGQLNITVRGFTRAIAEQLDPHDLPVSLAFDASSG
ncbi:hypothetical protein AURDEDRAFT_181810 [Auricularia subglabra TFB-10046 SS5]|nr:hypothetical protein AURDEDRAFT_181810 [Auricularia subglabra TFB-10046 SS5]